MEKVFRPSEVDALIPKIESVFVHMEHCQKRTQELAATRPSPGAQPSAAEIADAARIRAQMEFLLGAVQEDINLIGGMGGVVKDVSAGLVDFLGRVRGQDVWLCWKRGEKKIHFWHSLDTGFSERQSLPRSEERSGITH